MLLVIYLGTTAYVWIRTIKLMRDNDRRLKQEGYIFKCQKFSDIGDVITGIGCAVALSIPVLNLIFPLITKDKDRVYDEYKNMLLEAGSIEEPELENKDNSLSYSTDKKPYIIKNNHTCEKVIFKNGVVVNEKKLPIKVKYIGNIDNILELYRLNNENEEKKKKNIIDIDDSRIKVRTNKDGHIYYSTISKEENDSLDPRSYVYKKEFFKNRH